MTITPSPSTEFASSGTALDQIQTPCLLLDEARLRANLNVMRARLHCLGVAFRPHLKTSKSIDVARIAMTAPTGPAMVSTLREAEYFAEGGVRDITYGVGIAPAKLDRVFRPFAGEVSIWRSSSTAWTRPTP